MKTHKILPCLSICIMATLAHADVTVFAPASLTNAINDINALYKAQTQTHIKSSYASSGTLAKQIEQGAKAHIFISADIAWGKHLQNKGKIISGTYKQLLSNRLVLIAPKSSSINSVVMHKNTNFTNVLTGRLCTGNTNSVPVGRYAKQSLTALNWWQVVAPKLVETQDVRSALNFVNRGECQFGIVYATDVAVVKNVKIVGTFPTHTHDPIIYPVMMIQNTTQARQYYQFLQSPQAKQIYRKYGFDVL
ncbi:MAG: molybdate ABC transporter substrate-binding protein [Moraxella sp.]|nr:molybdate ABC transporter substrate-binding protein [Moraxella sp.]